MSWMQKLYETYENCSSVIGDLSKEGKRALLPICHMSAQAHIQIVIDQNGKFKGARAIEDKQNDAGTIIPCTESSMGRAGKKPQCHPLCDNLQYVAGDFAEYGGTVTSGFANDPQKPYRNYIKLLTDWCQSDYAHPNACAVLRYVKKGQMIKDLIKHQTLYVGSDGRLLAKWDKKKGKDVPKIFKAMGSQKQEDAFIRWEVMVPGEPESKAWRDSSLWESWIKYYSKTKEANTKKGRTLCYVTGEELLPADQHPKYIRRRGDQAKLISTPSSPYFLTYQGRFTSPSQACGVGFEVTQKAHNALQWLIDRQGKVFDVKGDNGRIKPGLTIVAWATSSDKKIPQPISDIPGELGLDELPSDEPPPVSTAQDLALRFRNRMLGYGSELGDAHGIVVLGLDSASDGRMAVAYYRELKGSDYLQRIDDWHGSCGWIHEYRYKDIQEKATGRNKRFYQPFIGAPAPSDIAEAAYGRKVNDRLRKATVERILPCIIDGQRIPRDLVQSAVRRASNRIAMSDPKDPRERQWNKTLTIACALFKQFNEKGKYDMNCVDRNITTRDYLYGRLLAIADRLEERSLFKAEKQRPTNAARYMQQFAGRPCTTWKQIHFLLTPYILRLDGATVTFYKNLIAEVKTKFASVDDFKSDKPLTGEFLLSYYCQREELRPKRKPKTEEGESSDEELNNETENNI